ncbi:unnamed protein product, partial [Sphacelaria rigidula]
MCGRQRWVDLRHFQPQRGFGETQARLLPVLLYNPSKSNPDAKASRSRPRHSTEIDFHERLGAPTDQTVPRASRTAEEVLSSLRMRWDNQPPSSIIPSPVISIFLTPFSPKYPACLQLSALSKLIPHAFARQNISKPETFFPHLSTVWRNSRTQTRP